MSGGRGLDQLEALFRQGKLSRRQFMGGLAALGMSGTAIDLILGSTPDSASAQPTPQATHLVIVVLDAFRADYLALAPMPTLTALAAAGTSFMRTWVGQLESYTPVGHATISTGSIPRNQGLIGFEWEDSVTATKRNDGWPDGVMAGDLDRDLRDSGVPSIPFAVKAADPHAQIVALSSEKIYAADAIGGWASDYTLYMKPAQQNTMTLAAVPGHLPPDDFLAHSGLKIPATRKHFTEWDHYSTQMALASFGAFKPRVMLVNLPGTDVYGHSYGGPASPQVFTPLIKGQDRDIAAIVKAYKAAGIFDQTLFVITADHGMVPNSHTVDPLHIKSAVTKAGGQYLFHTGGTAAFVYLKNPARAGYVANKLLQLPAIAAAYYLSSSNGQHEYLPASKLKIDPKLDAAYQYLMNTFVGPTAPAVVAPYRENTIGQIFDHAHGDHGGLNWGVQNIPLVISGPGVKQGLKSDFPARLIDIAPTVLRLMGVPIPGNMDGVVLADAVADATADEATGQADLSSDLAAHQDALIGASSDNQAEDKKRGIHPPPPRAFIP